MHGGPQFLTKPTLAMLPEIVDCLQRMVHGDWPELDVAVQVTDDGLISIRFVALGSESELDAVVSEPSS
jgi:hypothetical protein